MTTAKKAASKGASESTKAGNTKAASPKKAPAKKAPAKSAEEGNHCWPGFEPTPGKMAGTKGSCKPKAGKQTPAVRKADQKAAAASKLGKRG